MNRNDSWLINERLWRAKDYATIKKMGNKFLYLDESGANENLCPLKGYSKRGQPYIVMTSKKTERISCLLCHSEEKIIGC